MGFKEVTDNYGRSREAAVGKLGGKETANLPKAPRKNHFKE